MVVVGEITDKQRSPHWHESLHPLWLARFDVCRRQKREDSNLVVAMRGTPVAGRPADAAADDAPIVTLVVVQAATDAAIDIC